MRPPRLQVDLIKYDHGAVEGIAAYALHHLARTDAKSLRRWPRVCELAALGSDEELATVQMLAGSGPDAFESAVSSGATGGACPAGPAAAAADGVEAAERWALRLLAASALDMGLVSKTRALAKAQGVAEVPDTANAARRVLALLRQGSLGPLCLDLHPPCFDSLSKQRNAGRRDRRSTPGVLTDRRSRAARA